MEMVRPYWMPNGRILDTGVPEAFLNENRLSHKISRQDIKRFIRKRHEMLNKQDILKKLRKNELSIWQKQAGARKIA